MMSNDRFTIESDEILIWQQDPKSPYVNIQYFLIYGLGIFVSLILSNVHFLIGIVGSLFFAFRIFDKYVEARDSTYDLTHERLRIVSGGLLTGRQTYEIARKDIVDIKLNEPFLQQLFKIGTLTLEFKGDPLIGSYRDLVQKEVHVLTGITNPRRSYEVIRAGIKETDNRKKLGNLEAYKLNLDKKAEGFQRHLGSGDLEK